MSPLHVNAWQILVCNIQKNYWERLTQTSSMSLSRLSNTAYELRRLE